MVEEIDLHAVEIDRYRAGAETHIDLADQTRQRQRMVPRPGQQPLAARRGVGPLAFIPV